VNKNTFLQSKVIRSNIALFSLLLMLAGFFISRSMLSLGIILFGLNGVIGVSPRNWFKEKWWLLGVLWVGLYAVSWFWSNDLSYWNTRFQVKLPILLLPLAFAFIPPFSYNHKRIFSVALCLALLAGVAYTSFYLATSPDVYVEGYKYSHVLPTLIYNDHIVFSLTLCCGVTWCLFYYKYAKEKWFRLLLGISTVIFIIFLHILAVRSGLLSFYLFLILWIIYLLFNRRYRVKGLSLLFLFFVIGYAAVNYLPTLRNRIAHTNYTWSIFKEGQMSGDYSDMGRYMSFDIAVKLIRSHPEIGVGAGDILDSMKGGYDRWYPQVNEEQRLIPHNQFLTVAVAIGLPGLILFFCWVFYPLLQIKRSRAGFFFLAVWVVLLLPLLVEPLLEIQMGVFVYLFFLLWQRQAMIEEPENAKN
jgi:O-antigen ligase